MRRISMRSRPKLAEDNVGAIVSAMTLEEKAHLLVGTNLKSDEERAVVGYTKTSSPEPPARPTPSSVWAYRLSCWPTALPG